MQIKQKVSKAFSLIELSIALTIVAVLITMVASFYPKIMRALEIKRAVSYVEDDVNALKGYLLSAVLQPKDLKDHLPHVKDVYGNSIYVVYGKKLDATNVCFVGDSGLDVCIVKNPPASFSLDNPAYWNPSSGVFIKGNGNGTCIVTNGSNATAIGEFVENVAAVVLSPGKNRNVQTPVLCEDPTCTRRVVVLFPNVSVSKKFDYYPKIQGSTNGTQKWISAVTGQPVSSEPTRNEPYDDIARYLTLAQAKDECPPAKVVANIDAFWVDSPIINVGNVTTLHWFATYAGINVNTENVKCKLSLGDGGDIKTTSLCDLFNSTDVCVMSYANCIGKHSVQISYTTAGLKTPFLTIYDGTGKGVAMKSLQLSVVNGTASLFAGNFTAVELVYANGTLVESPINHVTVNSSTSTAKISVPVYGLVKFGWTGISSHVPCAVNFGDGDSSLIPDCSATNSTTHQYVKPGTYFAKFLVDNKKTNFYIEVEVVTANATGGGITDLPPNVEYFYVSSTNATPPYLLNISYKVSDDNGLNSVKVFLGGELLDGVPHVPSILEDPTGSQCSNLSLGGAKDFTKICSVTLNGTGIYTIGLDVSDTSGHHTYKFTTVSAAGGGGGFVSTSTSVPPSPPSPWTPPSTTPFANVVIQNPNNQTLSNFQVRVPNVVDALNCIYGGGVTASTVSSAPFDVKDAYGTSLPWCFEHPNGECNANQSNWTGAIWVKVPTIMKNSPTNLVIMKSSSFTAVDGSHVFDQYENFNSSNATGWNGSTGAFSLSSGYYQHNATAGTGWDAVYKPFNPYVNELVEAKFSLTSGSGGIFIHDPTAGAVSNSTTYFVSADVTAGLLSYAASLGNATAVSTPVSSDSYFSVAYYHENATSPNATVVYGFGPFSPSVVPSKTASTTVPAVSSLNFGIEFDGASSGKVDWIRTRKYAPSSLSVYTVCYASGYTPPPSPGKSCSFKISVFNHGNCNLTGYQFKVDISDPNAKACLSDYKDPSKPSFVVCEGEGCDSSELSSGGLPYVFELSDGSLTDNPDKWNNVTAVWVKIPSLPANGFKYLTFQQVDESDPKNLVGPDSVFDLYADFDNYTSPFTTVGSVTSSGNVTLGGGGAISEPYIKFTNPIGVDGTTIEVKFKVEKVGSTPSIPPSWSSSPWSSAQPIGYEDFDAQVALLDAAGNDTLSFIADGGGKVYSKSGNVVTSLAPPASIPPSVTDGSNVFDFYDDFSSGSLDTAKWDLSHANPKEYSLGSGILTMWGDWHNNGLWTVQSFQRPFVVEMRGRLEYYNEDSDLVVMLNSNCYPKHGDAFDFDASSGANAHNLRITIGHDYKNVAIGFTDTNWHFLRGVFGEDFAAIWADWLSSQVARYKTPVNTSGPVVLAGDTDTKSRHDYVDWFRVRKCSRCDFNNDWNDQDIQIVDNDFSGDNAIEIRNNGSKNLTDFQVRVQFLGTVPQYLQVENGSQVFYCFEQSNGECNTNPTNVIWIKVPSLPAHSSVRLVKMNYPPPPPTLTSEPTPSYASTKFFNLNSNGIVVRHGASTDKCEGVSKITDTNWHELKAELWPNGYSLSIDGNPVCTISGSYLNPTDVYYLALAKSDYYHEQNVIFDNLKVYKAGCGPVTVSSPPQNAKITVYNPNCMEINRPVLINTAAMGFDQFELCVDGNGNGKCDSGETQVDYCYYNSDGTCTAAKTASWTGFVYARVTVPASSSVTLAANFSTTPKAVDGTEWFKLASIKVGGKKQVLAVPVTNNDNATYTNFQVKVSLSAADLKTISGTNDFAPFKIDLYSPLSSDPSKVGSLIASNLKYCFEQPNGECKDEPPANIYNYSFTLSSSTGSSSYAKSGEEIFDFYDDFNDGVIDTSKWDTSNIVGVWKEDSSLLGNSGVLESRTKQDNRRFPTLSFKPKTFVNNYGGFKMELRIYISNYCTSYGNKGNGHVPLRSPSHWADGDGYIVCSHAADHLNIYHNGWWGYDLYHGCGYNQWFEEGSAVYKEGGKYYIYQFARCPSAGTYVEASPKEVTDFATRKDQAALDASCITDFDWVRVRKYSSSVSITNPPAVCSGQCPPTAQTPVVVKNTGSSVITDYQIRLYIPELKTSTFYPHLVVDDDKDPSNGVLADLNYCFEQNNGECNSTISNTGYVWVKVPNIPAGSTVYIYDPDYTVASKSIVSGVNIWVKLPSFPSGLSYLVFKKSQSKQAVNGEEVFDFYDDFENGLSKWTVASGSPSIVGGKLELNRQGANVVVKTTGVFGSDAKGKMLEFLGVTLKLNSGYSYTYRNRLYALTKSGNVLGLDYPALATNYDYGLFGESGHTPAYVWLNEYTSTQLEIDVPYTVRLTFHKNNADYEIIKESTKTSVFSATGLSYCDGTGSSSSCSLTSSDIDGIEMSVTEEDSSHMLIEAVRVRKYATTPPTVGSLGTYEQLTAVPADYPIKVDLKGVPVRNIEILDKLTLTKADFCFIQPNGECNAKIKTDTIWLKMPVSVPAGGERELIVKETDSPTFGTGSTIFTYYTEFLSLSGWSTYLANTLSEQLVLKQNGYASRSIPSGNYFVDLKVTKLVNTTLKVTCGGGSVTLGEISSSGTYTLSGYCPSGDLKLESTNNDPNAEVRVEYLALRDSSAGNVVANTLDWPESFGALDPIVVLDGVAHEVWMKVYNPNGVDLNDYAFPVANVGYLVDNLLATNSTSFDKFYIQDRNGNVVYYCFEQPNGECSTTPSKKRIWIKLSLPAKSSKWLRFAPYQFTSGNPAGLVDGSSIFTFYDNFNGTSLSSSWSVKGGSPTDVSVSGGKLTVDDNKVTVKSTLGFNAPYRVEAKVGGSGEAVVAFGISGLNQGSAYSLNFASSTAGYYQKVDLDLQNATSLVSLGSFSGSEVAVNVLATNGTSNFFVAESLIGKESNATYTDGGAIALGAWGSHPVSFDWVRVRPYAPFEPYLPIEFESYSSSDYSYGVSCSVYKIAYTANDSPKNVKVNLPVSGTDVYAVISGNGRIVPFKPNSSNVTLYYPELLQDGVSPGPVEDYIPLSNWFAVFSVSASNVAPVKWLTFEEPGSLGTPTATPVIFTKGDDHRCSCCDWVLRKEEPGMDYKTKCSASSGGNYTCVIDPDGIGPTPPSSQTCDMSVCTK